MLWRLPYVGLMFASLSSAGSLSGVVTDPSGLPLPAFLMLTVEGGTFKPVMRAANDWGRFKFEGLTPGGYNLSLKMMGFKSQQWNRIQVDGDVELPTFVLNIPTGCPYGDPPPLTRTRLILLKIKRFFVPIDWSKVTICQ